MKRINLLMIIFLFLSPALNCVRIDEIKDAELEVRETLNRFFDAVNKKNIDGILSFYLRKPATVMLGTGAKDRYYGTEQIKKKWSQKMKGIESMNILKTETSVQISSDLKNAWITSVNLVEERTQGDLNSYTMFFSAVLEKRAGRWLFRQTHFSTPKDNEKKNAPVVMETDSVIGEMNLEVKKLERASTTLKANPDSSSTSTKTEEKDY